MSKPIIAEYIWLSGANSYHDIRSKCKTLYIPIESALTAYPEWNFDGSSTGQAGGADTEILIRPVAKYPHPFIKNLPAVVILAECFLPDGTPTPDNTRAVAREIFEKLPATEPWFGQEQEYVLYKDDRPLNWPEKGFPSPQGPYYCSNGLPAWGRDIAMEHYETCLNMGLKLSGLNAEVMPSQWEFQVGPCTGIDAGDHMTVARWVYLRIGEKYGVEVNFDCKPMQGDWNGSGCHTNFSTKDMRAPGGIAKINEAIKNLEKTRQDDIMFYGTSNNRRLTGKHETSQLSDFTWGVGTRHTSIRIPNETNKNKCGYFEDRRPASDIDPYLVTSRILASSHGITENGLDPVKLKQRRTWMTRVNEQQRSGAQAPVSHTHGH